MPLVLFQTRRVRQALKAPRAIYADVLFLLFAGAIVGMLVMMARQASAPYTEKTIISLSFWALPKYTLMSLCRGFAAYFLSLVFTLIYATAAAHSHRAEKVMMPALDVLQSIPVLSFLPTVVLAMIALFPTRQIGLEIACVIMIFTAQAWNMTFSMYGSIKAVPAPLREAARVYRLGAWRVFRVLELPASMIGLVWNSMMSMAGGWFVLTISEAFTLKNKDFRLPGIGSYMAEAINQFDPHNPTTWRPILGALIAMILMIVAVDQLFWRPIVTWSERFKMEETAESDKPASWVLDLFQNSRIYQAIHKWLHRGTSEESDAALPPSPAALKNRPVPIPAASRGGFSTLSAVIAVARPIALWLFFAALLAGSVYGLWMLVRLLIALPIHQPSTGQDWLHIIGAIEASFLRTSASILIGAIWTLPVGILIGLSPKWSQRLQPLVQVVASFPAPMLFPLITLFLAFIHFPFTIGCVALMLLGTQWYILFNVIAGAMAIPGDLKEVQNVLGTGALRRWTRLYIPCVFPFLVTGLVTAAGGAWNATIVSEYVKVNDKTYVAFGIGSIISEATDSGNFSLLAAATVTLAAVVVLLNRSFWKRLYRVAEERYSLNA